MQRHVADMVGQQLGVLFGHETLADLVDLPDDHDLRHAFVAANELRSDRRAVQQLSRPPPGRRDANDGDLDGRGLEIAQQIDTPLIVEMLQASSEVIAFLVDYRDLGDALQDQRHTPRWIFHAAVFAAVRLHQCVYFGWPCCPY